MWDQFNPAGQGMLQLAELTLAFVLSALVGLEREIRQKSAGLRTYTLVGVSAAPRRPAVRGWGRGMRRHGRGRRQT
jgi:hypothetical protein